MGFITVVKDTFSGAFFNGGNETAVNDTLTAVLTAVFVTAVNALFWRSEG